MQDSGITVVLGASDKVERYSNKAMEMLSQHGIDFEGIGNKSFDFKGKKIVRDLNEANWKGKRIDTITLYLSAKNQKAWRDWIILSKPRRVIFNPGTENSLFEHELESNGIEVLNACTLVMLSTKQY